MLDAGLPDSRDVMWLPLPFVADLCSAAEHLHYAVRAPDDAPVDGLLFVMFASAALTPVPAVLLSPMSAAPE